MKTVHGAEMSPRMERLWMYLRAEHVNLSDFSTDECVAREMSKLREVMVKLEARVAEGGDAKRLDVLLRLRDDLDRIMRRVPQNRVSARVTDDEDEED